MQFKNMREALQYSIKIYKIIIPIVFCMFLVAGIAMLVLVPSVAFVGYILIGMGVLMSTLILLIMLAVKARVAKLLAQEKLEKSNTDKM